MKKTLFTIIVFLCFKNTFSQINKKYNQSIALSAGFGNSQSAIDLNFLLNKKTKVEKKLYLGSGLRITSFFGKNIYFTSAPAKLANDVSKQDSILAPKPTLTSANLLLNIGYRFTKKLELGVNFDAIGFSFGPKGSPFFITNGVATITKVRPTTFNLFLIGNNNIGSLNSELYMRYKVSSKVGIKLAYQYLYNELTTPTQLQTTPIKNDRFRNKASLINVGFGYFLNK